MNIFKGRKVKKSGGNRTNIGNKGTVILLLVFLAISLFMGLIGFITDFLWFKELDYVQVFFKKLFTQLQLGLPTFLVLTFLSYIYFKLIKKSYYKKVVSDKMGSSKSINVLSWGLAAIFGGIVTFFVTKYLWFSWLQFSNSQPFGVKDPIFDLDISFYVFKLDFLTQVNTLLIIILLLYILLTIVYYMLLMVARPPRIFSQEDSGAETFEDQDRFDQEEEAGTHTGGSARPNPFAKAFKGTPFEKMFTSAAEDAGPRPPRRRGIFDDENIRRLFSIAAPQLIIAGALLFVMIFIHFMLKQLELLHVHTGAVYGAGYTDMHVTLWVYRILAVLALVGAFMVIVGVKKHKLKTIAIVPLIMVVVFVGGMVARYAVQDLIVSPNEIAKESPYLEKNIEYTQKAYGLDKVKVRSFSASQDLTAKDIKNNQPTITNIRINDYEPTETFYNQTQSIRQYYTFKDVDVDRYMVNGEYTQTFLSAREIDDTKISQTWVNKYLKYTHGYGITLSRVDEITSSGQPRMLIEKIPSESKVEEIDIKRPEIYFGELTNTSVIVGATEDEFDYPDGDSNAYTRYEGDAGIKLNLINRIMFAIRERSVKLLVSTNIKSDSRIIINRNVIERVNKIMPYLVYEEDPYMTIVDGRLFWIIDAYTMSDRYPYSEPVENSNANYIRNSVKVVVDAYNGTTSYYVVDEEDPIALTYQKIFPSLFKDFDEMPKEVKKHIRYPNTLFQIQANVYRRYHMNDVKVFYQNEDLWDIANEIYGMQEKPVIPNYYILNLPGEKHAEFVNSISFTPKDKKNMTGLLLARNDGKDYGELILFKLPKSKVVYGPRQIEAQIDQDTEISKEFSLWDSAGSKYNRGNMFVIPIEDSLLYVEPVYLEASESSIPEVKRVIVAFNDNIAYERTLAEALDSLFGEGASGETQAEKKERPAAEMTSQELIKQAQKHYDNAIAAQKKGDWAEYGRQMDKLEDSLKKLQ